MEASEEAISSNHLYWIVFVSWNSSTNIDLNLEWKKAFTEALSLTIS